ncbi:magnesium transporter [Cardinium endosymbiont of Culicoides punctatus]|uniref:magnesium transporter n=1 Tax=Cardinium endosymbiont of Culicoides punctatus TaxID=2304601 RepID=UPI001058DDFC|nr:magnesium transporter [Cardinium endosymbiont of Culicoides punctatus]TDG95338.1 Magnesium transporter MgtE [Cardinium endosymbiont of Culicoides punctatus]
MKQNKWKLVMKWIKTFFTNLQQKKAPINPDHIPYIQKGDILAKSIPGTLKRNFDKLPLEEQALVFSLLRDEEAQKELFSAMSKSDFLRIFREMPEDGRVDFYHRLNRSELKVFNSFFEIEDRKFVKEFEAITNSPLVGVMNQQFITISHFLTVGEATGILREQEAQDAKKKAMLLQKKPYLVYVVGIDGQLVGVTSVNNLFFRSPQEKIADVLDSNFIFATIDEEQEVVAKRLEEHELISIPILNNERKMVGLLTYDDAIEIIRDEQDKDMEMFVGISSKEEKDEDPSASNYLSISSIVHLKKRIKWILIVFVASVISHIFTHVNSAFFTPYNLIFYISMITDTGGNVGSQAASVVLQALNRGQITLSDWLRILLKEIKIAMMLASVLFCIAIVKIFLIKYIGVEEHQTTYLVMFVVSFSIVIQVICSAVIGASLPLAAKYLKGDPAVAANPVINTVVEFLGTVIYFFVIYWLLPPK